ncbi:major facilitator superfamily domain-containing protein [Xylaria arbuscula]|nr:major facilitator superfamily domain-containing protein [Xylaria arbuscula]
MVFAGLLLAVLLTWLDGGTISTALPTISAELNLGPAYVWVANSYFLTTAAFQPLFGQLSDLWGRRWVFISAVALFVLGSGLIGGADNGAMFIAGRTIQGIGAGGINMLVDLVVCDLVPLRERGQYMGIIFGIGATISAVGPLVAGALTEAGPGAWRWIFWINLPLGGICILVMLLWLRVSHHREGEESSLQRLQRVDWVGTAIMVAATVSILWSLAYGGSAKPWSDGGIIGALVAGLAGLLIFAAWEGSPWCKSPLTPLRLFANRTSAVAFFLTMTNAMLIFWVVFMFPVYFQAVLGAGPRTSGLWLLPFAFVFPVFAAISGSLMTKYGRYRPLHLIGLALCTLGYGLCSILDENSQKALWVVFQIILAISIALPVATLLPAVQTPLSEADAASSTGAWAFFRSYGSIFGAAIPAAVFNDRFDQLLEMITDESVRSQLSGGQAYSQASSGVLLRELPDRIHDQVVHVYTLTLQRVWQIGIVFAGFSFLLALLERELTMRINLDTAYGLEEEKGSKSSESEA